MTELKQALGYLLDNGYLVIVANQVVVTRKLTDSLSLPNVPKVAVEAPTPSPSTQPAVSAEVVVAEPKKKVKKSTTEDVLKQIWQKLIDDAEIPWRVSSPGGGKYTVTQYGPTAGMVLYKAVNDPEIDYSRLVASIKDYYSNTAYRVSMCNYFERGIWRDAYQAFNKPNRKEGHWGNPFED